MPNYVYKDDEGIHELIYMSFDDMKKRQFKVDGKRGDFIDQEGRTLQRVYVPVGAPCTGWPLRSQAMGVDVQQVEEQTKYDRDHGVPTDYCRKSGDAIYRDANHRKKHLKLHGHFDRDSYS